LEDLRRKEADIKRDVLDGIDYSAGEITVSALVDRYISTRRGLKENTLRAYGTIIQRIHNSDFGKRQVKTVKVSDAKLWLISLHDGGIKRNTICIVQSVVRPAFEMAVEDDIIRKNPFKFKLADLIPDDADTRNALTKEQQEQYLQCVREYHGGAYYDDVVVLLGTGLRVSELYGLTKDDIDFDNRRVHVRRQLCRTAERPYFTTPPKTKSGVRDVPMTDTVYETLLRVVQNRPRPKVELLVDGCSGFIFLDKLGKPKVAMHLEGHMRNVQKCVYARFGSTFPKVTPHVLRHTFCTNLQQAGIDVKSLQYLMGHSNVSVTLDIYTHSDYASVEKAFAGIAANL
jgi:site-specific recombinase XerD